MHTSLLSNPVRNLRLIWCPYIPAEEEDSNTLDDPAKLLALLVGKKGMLIVHILNCIEICLFKNVILSSWLGTHKSKPK